MMDTFIHFCIFFVLVLTTIGAYRLIAGPTLFDRTIGVSLISNNAIIILIFIGFIFDRIDMFIDIAITYALLNFILSIVLGKYFERRAKTS